MTSKHARPRTRRRPVLWSLALVGAAALALLATSLTPLADANFAGIPGSPVVYLVPGQSATIFCRAGILNGNLAQSPFVAHCLATGPTTTTVVPTTTTLPPTTTTAAPTTTAPPTTTSTTAPITTTTAGEACTSVPTGSGSQLGAYSDAPQIVNSNGYNTYVANDMWAANPGTTQTICATSPQSWYVTADMSPAGDTGVQTYPDVQQLTNNWGTGGWNGSSHTPIDGLTSLQSTYFIVDPPAADGDWEAAYDIWTNAPNANGELMVWVASSTQRLASNGAVVEATGLNIGGQTYSYMAYGASCTGTPSLSTCTGGLPQLVLTSGAQAGTIDLLAVLKWYEAQGIIPTGTTIGQIDFGWEICNTAGAPETFAVDNYTLSGD